MRNLRRLGILAAATTLAGSAALAGAGVAGAQLWGERADITLDSPSSVTIQRVAGDIEVSYSNQSGRDLTCAFIVSNGEVIGGLYQHYRTAELIVGQEEPPYAPELQTKIDAAYLAEEFGSAVVDIEQGASGPVDLEGDTVELPTSTTFAPEALVICGGDPVEDDYGVWATYTEMETSATGPGASGEGIFGSLADLIPAFGS
ncbi:MULTISPECIES: hypothetical protein [Dietzia]|uniref:Secreted protein n=1 Tax=Dietzia maris TaxID=37915 RepID=A0ABT8GZH4_9ACTN|nr:MULTISPECIES: hypothetical protein [Dietzia]MDJ0422929.1 hypothetical protein [Dietzia kunjamensis]MDN4505614.1 hypothetical protein [Dietzia maris]